MAPLVKISEIEDIVERQAVLDALGHPDPEDISPITTVYYGHSFVNRFQSYMKRLPWYMDNLGIPPFEGAVWSQGHGGATIARLREKENINKGGCNCRNPPCPVNGNCLAKSVVYTGKLESDNPNQLVQVPVVHGYFGSAGGTFKDRYGGAQTQP